jgi:hypothetical protein
VAMSTSVALFAKHTVSNEEIEQGRTPVAMEMAVSRNDRTQIHSTCRRPLQTR